MVERSSGAFIGLGLVALVFCLSLIPLGWVVAAAFVSAMGLLLGGYVRQLHRLADRDELTGMCNRRPFERILAREFERAARYQRPLSLLFLDVDNFGLINKRYGHLMGDEALRLISRTIRQNVRCTDMLARWGGEEFVILLPETDLHQASALAERIRRVVEQCSVRDRDRTITITVSTGVAAYPGVARSASDLLRQAINGQAMAKVKKNTVVEFVS